MARLLITPRPLRSDRRPGLGKREVPARFDRVAARYDLLQRFNPGYRRDLRISARRLAASEPARLLDLCCGTGLSTEALVARYPRARIDALDASSGMLAVARQKPRLSHVRFLQGDAMDPVSAGATGPYDGMFMAYGLRNVPDPDLCLRRIATLLRPDGRLALHEYAVQGSRYASAVWKLVSAGIIVPLGTALTGSRELFAYLRESVLAFDSADRLRGRLSDAGFAGVEVHAMGGWQRGIVHTFVARRPLESPGLGAA